MSEPILACDSHHGVYAFQLLFNGLQPIYKDQAVYQLSIDDLISIQNGPDDEFYHEACCSLMDVTFTDLSDGSQFVIVANEDLWFVPLSFYQDDIKMGNFLI
jgi:hypothetical protein